MDIRQFKSLSIEQSQLINNNFPSLTTEASVRDAITMLAREPHFVIVTEPDNKKKFAGIFSTTDLAKLHINNLDDKIKVLDLVVDKESVLYVKPNETLEDVSLKMKKGRKVLPVITEQGEVKGIITSSDLLQKVRRDVHLQL